MATSHSDARFLVCQTCGEEFVFTVAAQEYFNERGLDRAPTKCKFCYGKEKRGRADGRENNRFVNS